MGRYRADVAQRKVDVRRHQQGRDAKCLYEPLLEYVVSKIKLGWSPEQISIRLPLEYPHDEGCVFHTKQSISISTLRYIVTVTAM